MLLVFSPGLAVKPVSMYHHTQIPAACGRLENDTDQT